MRTAALLAAGGSGVRLGAEQPKAFIELAGRSLVGHAAQRLAAARGVDEIVIICPPGHRDDVAAEFGGAGGASPTPCGDAAGTSPVPLRFVPGGVTRQASVAAGLAVLGDGVDVVLVHDAARPLAPPNLTEHVAAAVRAGHQAVVPGMPVTDTIKQVGPHSHGPAPVRSTLERHMLRAIQTPQGFDRRLLERAHLQAASRAEDEAHAASDDAGLVEELGVTVWVVAGQEEARKITTPADLLYVELLLNRS